MPMIDVSTHTRKIWPSHFGGADSTIAAKKFRPPFSCHFTKIGYTRSLTFIVTMIAVCKLKFDIY
jgi:hypothetical protein